MRLALGPVAEHADAVTARRELGGDGEGGRDVAPAVPGDDDDLGHDDSFGAAPRRRPAVAQAGCGGSEAARTARTSVSIRSRVLASGQAAVAAQQLPGVDVGGDDEQVECLLAAPAPREQRGERVGDPAAVQRPGRGS